MSLATTYWRGLLRAILEQGEEVRPRDRLTKELLAFKTSWMMTEPVVTCPLRRLGYRFMTAEAAGILSGDNRVSSSAPYSRHISQFSDDGRPFFVAYGPPFVDQVGYVAD